MVSLITITQKQPEGWHLHFLTAMNDSGNRSKRILNPQKNTAEWDRIMPSSYPGHITVCLNRFFSISVKCPLPFALSLRTTEKVLALPLPLAVRYLYPLVRGVWTPHLVKVEQTRLPQLLSTQQMHQSLCVGLKTSPAPQTGNKMHWTLKELGLCICWTP